MILAVALATVSCKKDKEQNGLVTPDNIVPDKSGKLYTPDQAKGIIENAALAADEAVDPQAFKPAIDLLNHIGSISGDEMDPSAIIDWLEPAVESLGYSKRESSSYTENGVEYMNTLTKMEWIYTLTPFTGKFTLKNNVWTREDSSDLSFIMPDANGKDCELTLTKSQKSSTIHLMKADGKEADYSGEWNRWEGYDPATGEYIYTHVVETEYTEGFVDIEIPETVTLSLKDNGNVLLSIELTAEVDVDGTIIVNEELGMEPEKAKVSLGTKVEIAGYTFAVKRMLLEKNKVSVSSEISKDKTRIAAFALSSESIIADGEDGYVAGTVSVGADLMGMLQISGNVDSKIVNDNMDKAYEAYFEGKEEKVIAKYVDAANKGLDLGIYFGTRERQASLEYDFIIEYEDEYSSLMRTFPVLVFNDGSKYSVEEYFDPEDFKKLQDALEKTAQEFAGLIDLPGVGD